METEGKSWVTLRRTLGGSEFVSRWPRWQPGLKGALWAMCDLDSAQAHSCLFVFLGHISVLVLFVSLFVCFQSFKHVNTPQLHGWTKAGQRPFRPSLVGAVKGMEWDWLREDFTRASLFFFLGMGACHVEGDRSCHSPRMMDIQVAYRHQPQPAYQPCVWVMS